MAPVPGKRAGHREIFGRQPASSYDAMVVHYQSYPLAGRGNGLRIVVQRALESCDSREYEQNVSALTGAVSGLVANLR